MVIIFARSNEILEGLEYLSLEIRDTKIESFLRSAEVSSEQASKISNRVNIIFNSDIFSAFSKITHGIDPIVGAQIMNEAN